MTHDVNVLRQWLLVVVIIAAGGATGVAVLYSLTPWRTRVLGKLFMLQAVAFASALDMTVLFQFWVPSNILILFWVEAIVFTLIALATSGMAWWVWRLNYRKNGG